jgi:glucan phosphoethanolaminetransferase (alkaline phosphatase superfamily)
MSIAENPMNMPERIWKTLMPQKPQRAKGFLLGAFGLVLLLYAAYLAYFEYNIAEWNPWGSPFNILASALLTFVLFSFLHLLSRRFWFSITIAMALVLFLAAWSDIKFQMNGFSLSVVDLMILDPAAISFALQQPDFRWHFVGAGVLFATAAALFVADVPAVWHDFSFR